jgi:hypothetical protein
VSHEVERPAGRRCDHWNTRCERLLDGLAERLVETGMNEHVERCHEPAQFLAASESGKSRSDELTLE